MYIIFIKDNNILVVLCRKSRRWKNADHQQGTQNNCCDSFLHFIHLSTDKLLPIINGESVPRERVQKGCKKDAKSGISRYLQRVKNINYENRCVTTESELRFRHFTIFLSTIWNYLLIAPFRVI